MGIVSATASEATASSCRSPGAEPLEPTTAAVAEAAVALGISQPPRRGAWQNRKLPANRHTPKTLQWSMK